jgi:23S rRNA pseudouridine1911/1915/1917 synthase
LIGEGWFRVRGRAARKGESLYPGDIVTFVGPAPFLAATPPPAADICIGILYEDDSVLVLDKPTGVRVHGMSPRATRTVANFLAARYPALSGLGRSRWELGLVHRLDQDTSGALLVAKTRTAFDYLRDHFQRGLIEKKYLALVWGEAPAEGSVDYPLSRDRRDRKKMKIFKERCAKGRGPRIWPAATRFRLLARTHGVSLLDVEIPTGVTHQIRLHLAAIGHPLVGDNLYDPGRPGPPGLPRLFLHAHSIRFAHPGGGAHLLVESPLPADLRAVLKSLDVELEISPRKTTNPPEEASG